MTEKRRPPIGYIDRTRSYYEALGYDAPYAWAQNTDVPLAPMTKPLSQASVALVTTAAPFQEGKGDQGPGAPYNGSAKFYRVYSGLTDVLPDLRISHIAIDRKHTSAEDSGTWFPYHAMKRAVAAGRVGSMGAQFFGLPTNRSQKTTRERDSVELRDALMADGVDAAILIPNCPVCHQSAALAARELDRSGIPSVVMGCAKDIVEQAGVSRFVFSDFPLGNSAGRPRDLSSQDLTLELALSLLESAREPRTTRISPLRWGETDDWKTDYSNAALLSPDELARRRAEFDAGRRAAKAVREGS